MNYILKVACKSIYADRITRTLADGRIKSIFYTIFVFTPTQLIRYFLHQHIDFYRLNRIDELSSQLIGAVYLLRRIG